MQRGVVPAVALDRDQWHRRWIRRGGQQHGSAAVRRWQARSDSRGRTCSHRGRSHQLDSVRSSSEMDWGSLDGTAGQHAHHGGHSHGYERCEFGDQRLRAATRYSEPGDCRSGAVSDQRRCQPDIHSSCAGRSQRAEAAGYLETDRRIKSRGARANSPQRLPTIIRSWSGSGMPANTFTSLRSSM